MATIEIPPSARSGATPAPPPDIDLTVAGAPVTVDVTLWSATEAVVTLAGELDAAGAPRVRQRIGELAERRVVDVAVDVGKVTFVDSSGMGMLVGCAHRLRAAGGGLRLLHPRPQMQRLLERTGWEQQLPVASACWGHT